MINQFRSTFSSCVRVHTSFPHWLSLNIDMALTSTVRPWPYWSPGMRFPTNLMNDCSSSLVIKCVKRTRILIRGIDKLSSYTHVIPTSNWIYSTSKPKHDKNFQGGSGSGGGVDSGVGVEELMINAMFSSTSQYLAAFCVKMLLSTRYSRHSL